MRTNFFCKNLKAQRYPTEVKEKDHFFFNWNKNLNFGFSSPINKDFFKENYEEENLN